MFSYFQEQLEKENEDGLVEKYKARRWLVRVTRKNLPWDLQQKLFAGFDVMSYQNLQDIVARNNFEVLENDDPHEILFQALENKNTSEVFRLIHEEHVSVTRNNIHALFLACFHGLTEVVAHLLEMKCVDPRPGNPLAAACESGSIDIVRMLLSDPRVDPTADESMPIQLAAQSGHSQIVEILLKDGRSDPNRALGNPLVCACAYGDTKVVQMLLADSRVDPTVRDNLPLSRACEQNAIDVVKLLLAIPAVNPHGGNKPLLSACAGGHLEIVKILINEHNADPVMPENQPFFNACYSGNLELVKFLLTLGSVDPSVPDGTPFQIAAQMNHPEIVKFLLQDPRIDPAVRSNYSLDISACSGFMEITKMLLADHRVRDTADLASTLRLAIEGEQKEVLEFLLSLKEPLFTPTPLMFCVACEIGNLELVEVLLKDPRVDPSAHCALYPIQFAASEGHTEIYKLLIQDPRVRPELEDDYAFTTAVQGNHIGVLELMLQDPRIGHLEEGLIDACHRGYEEVVCLLFSSGRLDKDELLEHPGLRGAFGYACARGYTTIIKAILSNLPDFEVHDIDIISASSQNRIETLRVLQTGHQFDYEKALFTAGREAVYWEILSWYIWPKWQLLKLALLDENSVFGAYGIPVDLFLDFVRIVEFAFPPQDTPEPLPPLITI
eukprot:TRINITY_DN5942_c0_g1_i1.p1 TRINITY_DN5942_c0_g1~~TRINITY_DN5942_c0_g1_i1.p1  ORF type:complete len:668 (-),score=42.23 TRINITY_DN5942_c0_g1_i1:77-2080(-)